MRICEFMRKPRIANYANRFIVALLFLIIFIPYASANNLVDSDLDGVPDQDETNIYHTDISKPDTDGDGYSDWLELNTGFSPLNPKPVRLEDNDFDNDGLSDRMELNFHTDLSEPDTDGDGFEDGDEIMAAYDPLNPVKALLGKRIEINTGPKQELSYFLGGV